MSTEDPSQELLTFLSETSPISTRVHASEILLGLTGSSDGKTMILQWRERLSSLLFEMISSDNPQLQQNSLKIIVNLSAEENAASILTSDCLLSKLFLLIISDSDEKSKADGDLCCMSLSNIAHWQQGAMKLMVFLKKPENKDLIFQVMSKFFKIITHFHHLATFFSNLTQNKEARLLFLDREKQVFQKLLSFISFKSSKLRQKAVVATVKNCCFEIENHEWLLGEEVDVLPRLLLPLAGPEEFTDEENDQLPIDLQYLEEDKKREEEPEIRKMLVEAVNQLCATKVCRKKIKEANTYLIMRELHKWEKDEQCLVVIENLVSVLISDEPEDHHSNLNEVEIPDHVTEKLNKQSQGS